MRTAPFFIFFVLILIMSADISYSAGMIMRIQQMKAKKHQQSQGVAPSEQQQQKPPSQQVPLAPTYQQTVDQRNQAIAQAILDAHNSSVSTDDQQTGNVSAQTQATMYAGAGQLPAVSERQAAVPAGTMPVQEVVDLSEVWKKLDRKSTVWPLLIDEQAKILTVSEFIDRFHKEGVKINEPPLHYVQMIDQITQGSPQMLERPFGELLQISAIVDYDFDNGMNKDDLARKVLGEAGFEANKKRFSKT